MLDIDSTWDVALPVAFRLIFPFPCPGDRQCSSAGWIWIYQPKNNVGRVPSHSKFACLQFNTNCWYLKTFRLCVLVCAWVGFFLRGGGFVFFFNNPFSIYSMNSPFEPSVFWLTVFRGHEKCWKVLKTLDGGEKQVSFHLWSNSHLLERTCITVMWSQAVC